MKKFQIQATTKDWLHTPGKDGGDSFIFCAPFHYYSSAVSSQTIDAAYYNKREAFYFLCTELMSVHCHYMHVYAVFFPVDKK
jgi:hypothetical protein